ncbi:D-mannonate oxidoreductase [Duganella rhizosphaerae]|uniref:mannitol dehydrogenase family protein n=1 Tax=Duganella rhizosphaerae TaxID=2885763 RepID=UPI0030EA311E
MHPILQFGTSRFLQAHADLFVSEALVAGNALGPVTVVQTTASKQSARRIAAFNAAGGYPVHIRGVQDGKVVDRIQQVGAIRAGLVADHDWLDIREQAATTVRVIISNTGDRGYELSPHDHAGCLASATAPRSFPAKLLALLHARYLRGGAPITILPCELVANNGSVLRDCVLALAAAWSLPPAFPAWLRAECVWVNSLVDRIVSAALEPAGAVAEPYALWAIEAQPKMVLPCTHPQMVVTDRLPEYERRKLLLLNLAHTWLAELWLRKGCPVGMTVLQAMHDPDMRGALEAVWQDEVMPLFGAWGEEAAGRAYLNQVRERFSNPYLAHRLADIAQNHEEKKQRRLLPAVAQAEQLGLGIAQPRLRAALDLALIHEG